MARRVLVIGNCNAQYLGAALRACTNLDVRVFGELFDGPVHFRTILPVMTTLMEGYEWLKGSPEKPLVLAQTAPLFSKDFLKDLDNIDHDLILFPFIRYTAIDVRTLPDGEAGDRELRRAMRRDAIFNELSLAKAGLPADSLKELRGALAAEPGFYMNSHFTGRVHAELFALMTGTALDHALGEGGFVRFLDTVREDIGIAHILGTMPHPHVLEALGIRWSLPDLIRTRYNESVKTPAVLKKPGNGVTDFGVFRTHINQYGKTKSRKHLIACLRTYKAGRLHLVWAGQLAEALIARGKPWLAALLLCHRLVWDDARGSTLLLLLEHMKGLRRSKGAQRLLAAGALTFPDSNLPLASECLKRIVP